MGLHGTHTIIWERESVEPVTTERHLVWPTRFSRLFGDKTFGLLVAHIRGVSVPATTVINRRVGPFSFGTPTGTAEHWLRTAPREAIPGYFPTTLGWEGPFELLMKVDTDRQVASVLAQESVERPHRPGRRSCSRS